MVAVSRHLKTVPQAAPLLALQGVETGWWIVGGDRCSPHATADLAITQSEIRLRNSLLHGSFAALSETDLSLLNVLLQNTRFDLR